MKLCALVRTWFWVSPDDEDEIKGELATLEAEAKTEARTKGKMQEPVELEVTSWDSVSEAAQHARPRTSVDPPDRRPVQMPAE